MGDEQGAERDDEREAQVLSERELIGLVAPDAAPGDARPPAEAKSEDDEAG